MRRPIYYHPGICCYVLNLAAVNGWPPPKHFWISSFYFQNDPWLHYRVYVNSLCKLVMGPSILQIENLEIQVSHFSYFIIPTPTVGWTVSWLALKSSVTLESMEASLIFGNTIMEWFGEDSSKSTKGPDLDHNWDLLLLFLCRELNNETSSELSNWVIQS